MRVAVIDLGTNTFNLLVVHVEVDKKYTILHSKKLPVKLGEGGINRREIIPAAYQRGLEALKNHSETITEYRCEKTYAFATSGLRTAKNSTQFLNDVKAKYDIEIKVISGDMEAELIYHGVKQAVSFSSNPVVILDIGGGSNEFIIANNQQIFWKQSFPLGIARLLEKFTPSNPITKEEIISVNQYIHAELRPLFDTLNNYKATKLVGASGSFETFASMLAASDMETETSTHPKAVTITPGQFKALYNKLITSTTEQRRHMKGLELMRIEMIVLASVFVNHIMEHTAVQEIVQSNFAMKEGIIWKLIHEPEHL